MTRKIEFLALLPTKTIILWDTKYRAPGGSYPCSLPPWKVQKWKHEIEDALNCGDKPVMGQLSGSKRSHLNGAIAEINSHGLLILEGHFSIQSPGRTTAGGVDFITYYHGPRPPADWQRAARLAFSADRVVGRIFRWPTCVVTS